MAILPVRKYCPLLAVAALSATVAFAPGVALADPHAAPSIDSVQKRLGRLALQNDQLVEKYNAAQTKYTQAEKSVTAARTRAESAGRAYETQRQQFVQVVQAQYEGSDLGAAGALFESDSGNDYLDRLDTMSAVSDHFSSVVHDVDAARVAAQDAAEHAEAMAKDAKAGRDAVAAQRKDVTAQIAKYRDLLSTLNSQQRYVYQRATNPSVSPDKVPTVHAGSAAAAKAVNFALDQVGKPYVFGAGGPSSYDCSGLTMQAWSAGGVNLPHSAAGQYGYGTHVDRNSLEPGDLLFFYSPISHVTIYAGNGMMVSAPTEGQNVSVVPVAAFDGDYVGATRLG